MVLSLFTPNLLVINLNDGTGGSVWFGAAARDQRP